MNPPLWRRALESITTQPPALSLLRWTLRLFDVRLFRLMSGRSRWGWGYPFLLLTTTGARSGLPRSAALLCIDQGDEVAVIGSNFAGARDPAWCHNLRAHPACTVLRDGCSWTATARAANAAERESIWAAAVGTYSGYEKYAQRVDGRVLPIFVLTPTAPASPR